MLTKEENELLCRVGPGTPMGDLMRQYWIPVMLSSESPEADGDPMRVKLLGENLVIFRDTVGRIGLLSEYCPHRNASLFFGRNEEGGLRCVYHGWKFDVEGNCVDMSSEPPERRFKIRMRAYRCQERGGMIWTYMGPRKEPPPLPDLDWMAVPAEHRVISRFLRYCNWLQSMEGDLDTVHLYHLHSRLHEKDSPSWGVFHRQRWAQLEVVETKYGTVYAARRQETEETDYCRITQFMFPFHTLFPGNPDGLVPGHIWVPLDDEHTWNWGVGWNPVTPFSEEERKRPTRTGANPGEFLPPTSDALGRWRPVASIANDFLMDREAQRKKNYTGIPTIPLQDTAVQESMGPISNRTQEHLGSSDTMIVTARRRLLQAARALREQGVTPPGVDNPEWYRVRSASVTLPRGGNWLETINDWLYARSNEIPRVEVVSPQRPGERQKQAELRT